MGGLVVAFVTAVERKLLLSPDPFIISSNYRKGLTYVINHLKKESQKFSNLVLPTFIY